LLDTKYEFISAYLRGGEAKIITHEHISRISRASSFPDVLTDILDTDIGNYLDEVPVNTFEELDEHLWGYLRKCFVQIETFRFVPGDVLKILRAYVVKYDVHNIKAALQQILTGKKGKLIPLGVIHSSGLLNELSEVETTDSIIEILNKCGLRDYIPALEGIRTEEGAKPSMVAEAELDSIYYKNILDKTRGTKDGLLLAKAFGLIIDLTNLQIVSRAIIEGSGTRAASSILTEGYLLPARTVTELLPLKLGDVPDRLGNAVYQEVLEEVVNNYNRTHSITSVEETIDKYKFSLVRDFLSPRVLSPLVIVWYLVLKEVELRNLRLIAKAIFDNISPEEIREYLVVPT